MLTAIDGLTILQFIVLALAVFMTFIQLAGLAIHAIRGTGTTLVYGWVAFLLWIALFALTR